MTGREKKPGDTHTARRIRFFNTFEPVTSIYRDLLPELARAGMLPEAVISRAQYRSERGKLQHEVGPGIAVRQVYAPTRQMDGRLSRIGIIASYAIGAGAMAMLGRPAVVNVFLTQPPLFATLGRFLKVLRRQPYVCIVMDLYPDLAIQAGLIKRDSMPDRILRRGSLGLLRNAAAVVVIGRCMRNRLIESGIDPAVIHLIPNWADAEVITPVPHNQNRIRQSLGLQDQFVVMYSGNLGVSHELDSLLQAAVSLRDNAAIRFVIAGGGVRLAEVLAVRRRHNLDNIILAPLQPAARLAESLSVGDVHFVSLRPGFEGLVVPSKAYGAMAAGRALIYQGDRNGEIARMIQQHGCGVHVMPGDAENLTDVLARLSQDRARCREMGARARALSEDEYAKSHRIEQYLTLLQNLGAGTKT